MKPQSTESAPYPTKSGDDVERAIWVRRLGSSFAHVLANSLNVIGMRASMLTLARDPAAAARAAEEISSHVAHISSLFDQLQRYVEALEPRSELVDLEAIAKAALAGLETPENCAKKLEISAGARRQVVLPGAVVEVVFSSLIEFALRTTKTTASLAVVAERVQRGANQLEVAKIELVFPPGTELPRDRRTLLDPWLTSSEAERERILLALAVGAVRDRGGWFEIEVEGNPSLTLFWPARGSHVS